MHWKEDASPWNAQFYREYKLDKIVLSSCFFFFYITVGSQTYRYNELAYRKSPNENPERSKSYVSGVNIHITATKMISVQSIYVSLFEYDPQMYHWFVDKCFIRK